MSNVLYFIYSSTFFFQPMVHCISSSEPDSGDIQVATDDWRIHGIATKEITLNHGGVHGKTYVESTVTTGIQVGNRLETGNNHLNIIDMHQPADTTHPEKNTYADSQEYMDTSSPNHSIYSDTMEHMSAEENLNIDKSHNNLLPIINHGHYQTINSNQNSFVLSDENNVYRQQHTLVPDHADYTLMPNNKFPTRTISQEHNNSHVTFNQQQCYKSRINDTRLENQEVEQRSLSSRGGINRAALTPTVGSYLSSAVGGNEKVMNFGVATTPGLYPHLYDTICRSHPNEIAVVNYPTNKSFVNPFITNQFTYDDQSDDENEDDTSDEE